MIGKIKGQVSFEFIMLFSVLLTIFVIYIPIFSQQAEMIRGRKEYLIARRTGLAVKKEINMANIFGEGYRRNFTLPNNIAGHEYTIEIEDGSRVLVLEWEERNVVEEIITPKINGTPKPGKNTIRNVGGVINFS